MSKLEPDDSVGKVTHTLDNQSSLDKGLEAKREGLFLETRTKTKRDYTRGHVKNLVIKSL